MGPSPGYWWARIPYPTEERLMVVLIVKVSGELWVRRMGEGTAERLDDFEEGAELVRKIEEPE